MNVTEETKQIQEWIQKNPHPGDLPKDEITEIYGRLIDCVMDHTQLYHIQNNPIISDKEYDDLFAYLKKIEENFPGIISGNSPTQSLIGQIAEGFNQAQHKVKLLSLENSYNADDLKKFDERVKKILEKETITEYEYEIEPKFDGLSVELIYENGKFVQAITRGDGTMGDDITSNAKTIKSIPKTLKQEINLHIRGEIIMPKSVWKTLNKEREELGLTPFANPRNAAAGSIKLLDSGEVAKRNLICFVYDILSCEPLSQTQDTTFNWLENIGLPVVKRNPIIKNIDEVIATCIDPATKKHLDSFDYDFDGLVIKIVGDTNRKILGATEHHPRRAIAYKFPAQVIATQVNSIDFQVGRTGIITPVANLEPVQLSGVTIKRVSLHNFDFIKEKDIHIHDWIRLQRSGEVIPYIVSTIKDRRPNDAQEIIPPKTCPSCGSEIINEDIHYYCTNTTCPAQIKERLLHFTSKNCMDIEGIGESTIDLLVENNIIKNIEDIYKLVDPIVQVQIIKFPGFGNKKIGEITKQIEESKKKPLRRLLNGLGMNGVGKKTAQEIVRHIVQEQLPAKNLDDLITNMTNESFLVSIYGIGEKIIEGIKDFFFHNKETVKTLEHVGINFDANLYNDQTFDEESSKGSFSITGTFPVKREAIIQAMQNNGYFFNENPTKTTNIMLIGEDAGSKKAKAEEYELQILEGWEAIVENFPFLKDIPQNNTKKIQAPSLF